MARQREEYSLADLLFLVGPWLVAISLLLLGAAEALAMSVAKILAVCLFGIGILNFVARRYLRRRDRQEEERPADRAQAVDQDPRTARAG